MVFKQCKACGKEWSVREAFLKDPKTTMFGYEARFEDLELGLFLFNHTDPDCGRTMTLEARHFSDLYDGPVWTRSLHGTEECLEYCKYVEQLIPCPNECECAYVREGPG